MLKGLFRLIFTVTLSGTTFSVMAVSPDELDLLGSYGSEELVSIAAGYQQPIAKAPGVASVITAADIKAMGARDLNEVLESVPGVHVTVSPIAYNPIVTIRGIYSEFNPQVLFLVNGIPITNFFLGNRGQVWGGMQVENIARIEVLRSPGSAIYGADAVAGVINIITKSTDDINGTEVGGRVGSFDDRQAWVLHGKDYSGWKTAFSMQYRTTEGQRETVDADAQTGLDARVGTSASLAPGPVSTGRDLLDASIDVEKGRWRGRLMYQGRRNIGIGAGAAEALDPEGSAKDDRFLADVRYENTDLSPDWDFDASLSYFDVANKSELVLFPPGADFTALGGGAFPEGVRGNPGVSERHLRFETTGLFTGFNKHAVRLGLGYHNGDMYEITETKNFIQNPFGVPVPLGGMTDVSDSAAFVEETDRQVYFAYAQDEWKFAPDWALTMGLRYDDYSDFGGTFNPRLALVWQTTYDLTSKLLYGRAFRPPSFAEQFNINNPVALGNPNLDPETIDTVELAFDYRPTDRFNTNVTLFHYTLRDIIRFVADPPPLTSKTAQNTGKQVGYGLEWEVKWNMLRDVDLIANYAFQRSEDKTTGADPGIAPGQQLYVRGDWRFLPSWSFHAQLNHVRDRERQPDPDETRTTIDDYTTVDLTLRRHAGTPGLEYAFSIRNLFDADAREPSPAPGLIPNDLPLAGRQVFGEIRYTW